MKSWLRNGSGGWRGCLVALLAFLTAGLAGCGGDSSAPPLQLTVSASQTMLAAGQSTQIMLTQVNAPAGSAVFWTVSCSQQDCGQVSPTSTTDNGGTTYTAPATAPPANLTVTITARSAVNNAVSASVQVTVSSVAISLSLANGAVVPAGTSTPITATVINDSTKEGVKWSVSCASAPCGSVSPATTASGAAATYTAPAAAPAADLSVTLTATSVGNPVASASVTITVPALAVAITLAGSSTVPAGASLKLTATVSYDQANKGVTWTVQCSATNCGTLSASSSASGQPVTYTAPPSIPVSDLAVTLTATSVTNPATSATTGITVPAIAVAVSTTTPTNAVTAGATLQLTATVSYDPANKGVTWTVSCSVADCGTVSPLSSASGQAVTYTAPATPPPTDLQVTVTARSVSAAASQGSVQITVKAVTVAITPVSALVPLSLAQQFIANVGYDPTASGVSWQLLQAGAPCPSACGAISPLMSANGAAVTYTAPASLPANTTVTVKATSVTESSSTVTGTVIVTNGSVQLVPVDMSFIKVRSVRPPPQTATMTNRGHSTLRIADISIGGTGAAHFGQSNTCGTSLAAGASCSITVSFNWHIGFLGTVAAVLSIADSSSDSPQKINLVGSHTNSVPALVHAAVTRHSVLVAPPPTGASEVGTREVYLPDSRRTNPYVANDSRRELMVRFWYPLAGGSGAACTPADYTSPQTWEYFGTLLGVTLPKVLTNSCRDGVVAPGPHPVVLLSHGFTGTSTDYTYLAEDLASRGYVVASIDHTHEATAVTFPGGRLEKGILGSYLTNDWHSDPGTLGFAVAVRSADLKFVLDELAVLNAGGNSDFAGRLDLSRIAVMGHSLGGLTAIRALEDEPRVKAAVLLDAVVPPHVSTPVRQPVLNLVVGRQWNETDCNLWHALSGKRLGVDLPGAEHLALSDAVWLLKGSVETGSNSETMIAAIRDYVAAFLDASLGGKDLQASVARIDTVRAGAGIAAGSQSLCTQP